ncbi:hypothetical protein GCM10009839_40040 [Catenulispora yoronensis]|uniref:Uncharacterized protein n=1 Tax=Catenulispora yoronensis TaxID=450799 RepID=A0ABP5FW99_9ACTN
MIAQAVIAALLTIGTLAVAKAASRWSRPVLTRRRRDTAGAASADAASFATASADALAGGESAPDEPHSTT